MSHAPLLLASLLVTQLIHEAGHYVSAALYASPLLGIFYWQLTM